MRFASLHKAVTFLTAGLGLWALTLGSELGAASTVFLFAAFIGSWFVEGAFVARPFYARLWTWAVIGVFALQIARGVLGEPVLALGIEYAGFLQISRLSHRRTARDHQHIVVLAFVHLIAASVLSTGLDFALAFFGFVVVTPWMLALTHLRGEIEGNYGADDQRPAADVKRVLASRRVAGPGFLLGTALLSVPLFVVTAALFLLFPRVGMGFLSFSQGSGQRVAGFGRNVELGGFGVIRDDPTVVVRVRVPGLGPTPPASLALRLRGTSFDHYDGRRWMRTTGPGEPIVPTHRNYYPLSRLPNAGDRRYEIIVDPLDEPVIFLPAGTVGLTIDSRVRGGMEISRRVLRATGLDVRYADQDALGLTYTVNVSADSGEHPDDPPDAEETAMYLQLPAGQDRVAAYARRVTRGALTDGERASRLLELFQDPERFRYSLEQPDTRGRDPLHVFLFDSRSGHCEYFSTAMAVMLRTLGIPARNVTGFIGGRYNGYGHYYALRQGDAHSWVEAFIDGRWVVYDPTPPSRDAYGPSEGLLGEVQALLDALRTRWASHVVGYDLHAQTSFFSRMLAWLSERGAIEEGGAGEGSTAAEDDPGRTRALAILIGSGLLLALGLLLLFRPRIRLPRARRRREEPAVVLYRELERALRRRGRPRPPAETPLEHARTLARSRFPAADAVEEVTAAYLAARYGGRALGQEELARLRSRVREVRSAR